MLLRQIHKAGGQPVGSFLVNRVMPDTGEKAAAASSQQID
jgi:hypothetical protein